MKIVFSVQDHQAALETKVLHGARIRGYATACVPTSEVQKLPSTFVRRHCHMPPARRKNCGMT